MSDKPRLSDEELCARIRGYWYGVRGGELIEARVSDGETVALPNGHQSKTRRIVSNLGQNRGMPPGVRASDVPGFGGRR
jgi:hypothetical protein